MEKEIFNDEFESFLKENADDFVMVPSRKVWYSIYNNMHPDRKWPSMAVCLIILSAVLYIGISNNNSISLASQKAGSKNFTGNIAVVVSPDDNADVKPNSTNSKRNNSSSTLADLFPLGNYSDAVTANNSDQNQSANTVSAVNATDANISGDAVNNNTTSVSNNNDGFVSSTGNRIQQSIAGKSSIAVHNSNAEGDALTSNTEKKQKLNTLSENAEDDAKADQTKKNTVVKNEQSIVKTTADIDRSWKEDYAFRNKPLEQKLKNRGSISYYITPSFGYRGFFKNKAARSEALNNTPAGNENLNDGAALNLEIGSAINYKVSRNVRLKAGLQANYTNYVSKVTGLDHPTQAILATGNNSSYRYSEYAVKEGYSRLNKTTLQVSMPLGADLKLVGRKKIKWYAGGTIQPTYVISGSAYVLSADGKNYISETALLRKWNVNAAVETFVTLKPSSGVTVSLGPQFRYQLLSTYKKEYNYTEKLYNIGFKIGLTTDF